MAIRPGAFDSYSCKRSAGDGSGLTVPKFRGQNINLLASTILPPNNHGALPKFGGLAHSSNKHPLVIRRAVEDVDESDAVFSTR